MIGEQAQRKGDREGMVSAEAKGGATGGRAWREVDYREVRHAGRWSMMGSGAQWEMAQGSRQSMTGGGEQSEVG